MRHALLRKLQRTSFGQHDFLSGASVREIQLEILNNVGTGIPGELVPHEYAPSRPEFLQKRSLHIHSMFPSSVEGRVNNNIAQLRRGACARSVLRPVNWLPLLESHPNLVAERPEGSLEVAVFALRIVSTWRYAREIRRNVQFFAISWNHDETAIDAKAAHEKTQLEDDVISDCTERTLPQSNPIVRSEDEYAKLRLCQDLRQAMHGRFR